MRSLLLIILSFSSLTAMADLQETCEENFQSRGYESSACQYESVNRLFVPLMSSETVLSERTTSAESTEVRRVQNYLACVGGIERYYNIREWNAFICIDEDVQARWSTQSTRRCMENLSSNTSHPRFREGLEKLFTCSKREVGEMIADPLNTSCTYSGNAVSLNEQGIVYNQQDGQRFGVVFGVQCRNLLILRSTLSTIMNISDGIDNFITSIVEDEGDDSARGEKHWIDQVPVVRRTSRAISR